MKSASPASDAQPDLTINLVFILALGAGITVASIYYSQPLLSLIGREFQQDSSMAGQIPTFTQIGYALGILLLTPLGDRFDRRRLILIKGGLLVMTLLVCAWLDAFPLMIVVSLFIGILATVAQDIVPTAAILAPERRRGKIVGIVMTGLLGGILLSRVFSGVVGEYLGWRAVYLFAALMVASIILCLGRFLPDIAPTTAQSVLQLWRSLFNLWRRYPELRCAAVAQGILSLAFSAFWSTLAVMLHQRFGLDSAVAGLFGLAGAAGTFAAPLAGGLADRIGPDKVTQGAAGLVSFSFAIMLLMPWYQQTGQLVLLALSAIGFDLGVQASLIAHQTLIFRLDTGARSRLNALLFTTIFIGMALGSTLGSFGLARYGWNSVVIIGIAAGAVALVIRVCKQAES